MAPARHTGAASRRSRPRCREPRDPRSHQLARQPAAAARCASWRQRPTALPQAGPGLDRRRAPVRRGAGARRGRAGRRSAPSEAFADRRRWRRCWRPPSRPCICRRRCLPAFSGLRVAGGHRLRPRPAGQPTDRTRAGQRRAGRRAGRRQRGQRAAQRQRTGRGAGAGAARARPRSGRPRCCAPAWERTSGCRLVEGLAPDALDGLQVPLVATSSHAAQTLQEARLPRPCAWVFGHEGQGISPAVQARCALSVRIPQPGGEESLNVAAAAAICLYEAARRG